MLSAAFASFASFASSPASSSSRCRQSSMTVVPSTQDQHLPHGQSLGACPKQSDSACDLCLSKKKGGGEKRKVREK